MHWPIRGNAFYGLIYRNIVGNASVPLFRTSAVREIGGYRTRAEQGGVSRLRGLGLELTGCCEIPPR